MPTAVTPASSAQRLMSLDAYRGAIILLMASSGLGLAKVAEQFPDSAVWRLLGYHAEHAPWRGCTLWDLIQPAFMFMVGVSLPWSVANRRARGQHFLAMFAHALWRAVLLVVIAIVLSSNWSQQTDWSFNNVLAQIGLGYPFLFLLAFTDRKTPWLVAGGLLLAYWLAFALYPLPAESLDRATVGLAPDWPAQSGFAAHWEKSLNLAAGFDSWFMNLFPREAPYTFNSGGYQTLNFIPALATMIFGLLAGRLLHGELPIAQKVQRLVLAGLAGIALGPLIDYAGLCPIVKRIWTPSWTLYSAGWVTLLLAAFLLVVDGWGWRRWAFPLVVAGLNPITLYVLWQLSSGFIRQQFQTHLGQQVFATLGETWTGALERAAVLIVLWLIVWWMYRQRIFVRI